MRWALADDRSICVTICAEILFPPPCGKSFRKRIARNGGRGGATERGRHGIVGEWLETALMDLAGRIQAGLQLDPDVVSGLVSYCELAPPEDAREYLTNIIGPETSQDLVREYLQRRGCYVEPSTASSSSQPSSRLQAYIKPLRTMQASVLRSKPQGSGRIRPQVVGKAAGGGNPRRKKAGKVVSLAEASRGAIVFKQGNPCSCQARRHSLVGNCLACGKIVCEQEGEGPCSFCGALVLREGSSYAGLEGAGAPASNAEATAEAFTKRLVEYDRNSAARTTVIDDQSDYYEFEGNSWLSKEEKDLLAQKLKEQEEEEERRKKKVVMTFDLVGRKVLVNEDAPPELGSEHRILRPLENRESHRITPNPAARLQPIFVDAAAAAAPPRRVPENRGKQRPRLTKGLCLEISGRCSTAPATCRGPPSPADPPAELPTAATRTPPTGLTIMTEH
ncbi:unnamed protein product [Spirodela intermedia]|uniref:Uncharacterized protein n=1 Tax=Spirodela intermedia TaxID=51605 RepID=A0A7I8J394_SPIIN|nr:unnamed protein product [Spirodela intermedia]CAA6664519.1 unnamed protein product [Spirodela intermedia]